MSDAAADLDVTKLIEHLKNASPRMRAKAKLIAAIGVIMHSKLPDEVRADMVMATVDSCALDVELSLIMHLTETHAKARKIGPVSMDVVVSLMGLELLKATDPAQDRMKNLATLFEAELGVTSVQL